MAQNNNSFAIDEMINFENMGYFAQKFFEPDPEVVPVKGTRKPGNRATRRKATAKALKLSVGYKDELVENPRVEAHHNPDYFQVDPRRVNRERQKTRAFCARNWRDEWDNEKAITRQTFFSGQIIKFGEDSDSEFVHSLEETLDFEWYFPEPEDPEDGLARDYGDPTQATTSLADLMPENINEQIQAFRFAKAIVDNSPDMVKEYLRFLLN